MALTKDERRWRAFSRGIALRISAVGVALSVGLGLAVSGVMGGASGVAFGVAVGTCVFAVWLYLMRGFASWPKTFPGMFVCAALLLALGISLQLDQGGHDLRWRGTIGIIMGGLLLPISIWGMMRHGVRAPLEKKE
jgi:hypothetical protein